LIDSGASGAHRLIQARNNTGDKFIVEGDGDTTIGGTLSVAGGISGDDITDGTIDSTEIEDNTIGSSDLAVDSV